ncbi:hypothetical protein Lgra_2696 [Legionella gratiana]|uniref:Uncharacterized protein n=1 Tax=Legionella gratiana TaxID=45066 RepID=A0A378J3R8_9GAMM|nr:hypothetical protein [Legionella gratiana]KTD05919.1 hypothetical protein Lgra_2696 [Legionella gratiana]STX42404.1 Uncharacterised protein [Legionella gratiana]
MPYPIEEQACSTWALSGDESRATNLHEEFSELTQEIIRMDRNDLGNNLQEQRQEAMRRISELRDPTEYEVGEMYLCGAFMNDDDIVPSHYWIEDRTHGITIDTFINRDSVVVVDRVGVDGEDFQPGCEAEDVDAHNIVRVPITGYTKGQVDILTNYIRPENVINSVIEAKRGEINSSRRALQETQYMLDHLDEFPHRNNRAGIESLQRDVLKFQNRIVEQQNELEELQQNRPERPALPESGDDDLRIDITQGDSLLKTAMQGALLQRQNERREEVEEVEEVREEVREPIREEVREPERNRSLLSSLNSTLGKFVMGIATIALVAGVTYTMTNQNK